MIKVEDIEKIRRSHDRIRGRTSPPMTKWARFDDDGSGRLTASGPQFDDEVGSICMMINRWCRFGGLAHYQIARASCGTVPLGAFPPCSD
jgi:hypothetical protein